MSNSPESHITRFGVSIEDDLLKKFDALIEQKGYANRSEALRDLIRDSIVEQKWKTKNEQVFGTLTIVYDHHKPDLLRKITALQHDYEKNIISTMHVHINHDTCLEVIVLRGTNAMVNELSNKIISLIGVKHGKLTATAIE